MEITTFFLVIGAAIIGEEYTGKPEFQDYINVCVTGRGGNGFKAAQFMFVADSHLYRGSVSDPM